MTKNGKLIAVVAPSGAGKSTLLSRLKAEFRDLHDSISYTTRPIRKDEEDGIHYHFISKEEFKKMIESDAFIEWAVVHNDHYYGSSKAQVEDFIKKGINVLFEIDIQGADNLKRLYKDDAFVIFITAPSFEELKKRLISRNTESNTLISVRLETAKKEMQRKDSYDYLVVNDEFERAYGDLKKIVKEILEKK